MTAFWGDESWRDVAYRKRQGLFEEILGKTRNEDMAVAYRKRLREVAGFEYVPEPLPMKNSKGAVVYYLYFASQNETGYKVAKGVLDKYREGGADSAWHVQDRMDRGNVESGFRMLQGQLWVS